MIQVDNLSKSYGKKMALDHITASIHDEHIFGLLGTNGAGKSTFLKILSGILKPDSGTVIIDDHPVFENELTKADICFLSDNPYFSQMRLLILWRITTALLTHNLIRSALKSLPDNSI